MKHSMYSATCKKSCDLPEGSRTTAAISEATGQIPRAGTIHATLPIRALLRFTPSHTSHAMTAIARITSTLVIGASVLEVGSLTGKSVNVHRRTSRTSLADSGKPTYTPGLNSMRTTTRANAKSRNFRNRSLLIYSSLQRG